MNFYHFDVLFNNLVYIHYFLNEYCIGMVGYTNVFLSVQHKHKDSPHLAYGIRLRAEHRAV